MTNTIEALQHIFNEHANDEKSISMRAYLKDQFKFKGIMKPTRAAAQKEWVKNLVATKEINWDLVSDLWQIEEREFQYVALDYLVKLKKQLTAKDMNQMEHLIVTKSWWDTVDLIASHLVGQVALSHPEVIETHLKKWSVSDNIWLSRTAILYQLKYKDKTNTDLLTEFILQNKDTKEFFLNKAIGWALREYSKTNKEWVREFIEQHELHSLSVREGSKYLV